MSTIKGNLTEGSILKVLTKLSMPIVIAAFLAVVILVGGTFAAVKFIPEMEDDDSTSIDDKITVLSYIVAHSASNARALIRYIIASSGISFRILGIIPSVLLFTQLLMSFIVR